MAAKMKRAADSDLGQAVLDQIRQSPELSGADVRVAVDRGVVTLTGLVRTESERTAIEAAAREVWGVEAIASDLLVKPSRERSDTDIARDVLNAFHNHIFIPASGIVVIVRDGRVTLRGRVHSELQRMLAEAEVKRLHGIASISNQLEVNPEAPAQKGIKTSVPENAGPSNESAWVETGEAEAG
ncbi:MAG: BON domain-containing protein [Blastocatellia bacterium]